MSIVQGVLQGINPGGSLSIPTTPLEWLQNFPTIAAPTSAYGCQDASGGLEDMFGANDCTAVGTVQYEKAGYNGRLAVQMDVNEGFEVPTASVMDPDGSTDMTAWALMYLPTPASTRAAFGKRGGTNNPGYSLRITTAGYMHADADPGAAAGVADSLESDHGSSWKHVALVLDRVADELRIETELGTLVLDISTLGSLSTTAEFRWGTMDGVSGTGAGTLMSYAAFWDGTALTREELLQIWSSF